MIYRRLLPGSGHGIADLHYAIQIAIGWTDSHLHQCHIHGKECGVPHEKGVRFTDDFEKLHLIGLEFRFWERFLNEHACYGSGSYLAKTWQ